MELFGVSMLKNDQNLNQNDQKMAYLRQKIVKKLIFFECLAFVIILTTLFLAL